MGVERTGEKEGNTGRPILKFWLSPTLQEDMER